MTSIIISLIMSMSHKISNVFSGNKDNTQKKEVIVKHNSHPLQKNSYVKSNNNIIQIKAHTLGESKSITISHVLIESGNIAAAKAQDIKESGESHLPNIVVPTSVTSLPKNNDGNFDTGPGNLSEYDDYAKSINDLKHQIEINKLQKEVYRSQIDYEDPGSYDNATMIGVVVDPDGYKSAKIKLIDDTITDLMVGSRLGHYIVTAIDINEVVLISTHCKRYNSYKLKHAKYSNHNVPNDNIIIHTYNEKVNKSDETEGRLNCKPVKIYPVYRDINNKLPSNNVVNSGNVPRNGGGALNGGGTSINAGGMTFAIPPIETAPHGN